MKDHPEMSSRYPAISWRIANARTVKNSQESICNKFLFVCNDSVMEKF